MSELCKELYTESYCLEKYKFILAGSFRSFAATVFAAYI